MEMEYLNHACKVGVTELHANVTPQAFVRSGKCIGPLTILCNLFDKTSRVPPVTSCFSRPDFSKDIKKIF